MLRTIFFALILLALCVPAVLAQPANPGQGQGQGQGQGYRYAVPTEQATPAPQGRPADQWPAFSMTYRETTATHDRSYSIEYTGPTHWTTTLVDNPAFPDMVGASVEYDGVNGVLTFHNPVLGDYTEPVKPSAPDENGIVGHRAPNGWLLPDTHLDQAPGAQVTRGRGTSTVVRQEGDSEAHTTVRPDGIPTEHVILHNGEEVYRATVLELTTH